MSQSFELNAELRSDLGKGASRRLRREAGKLPAIIYGGSEEPKSITLEQREIVKQLENESFYGSILDLKLEGQVVKVILKDLQRHPFKPTIIHADFLRVDESKNITVHIPLHFINEENCVGVKIGGGSISHNSTDVEITCLPKDLPEFIEVDMIEAEAGAIIHLSDLKLPEGCSIPALALGSDHDIAVASVSKPKNKE